MNVAVRYKNGDVVVSSVPKYLINFSWFEKFSDVTLAVQGFIVSRLSRPKTSYNRNLNNTSPKL